MCLLLTLQPRLTQSAVYERNRSWIQWSLEVRETQYSGFRHFVVVSFNTIISTYTTSCCASRWDHTTGQSTSTTACYSAHHSRLILTPSLTEGEFFRAPQLPLVVAITNINQQVSRQHNIYCKQCQQLHVSTERQHVAVGTVCSILVCCVVGLLVGFICRIIIIIIIKINSCAFYNFELILFSLINIVGPVSPVIKATHYGLNGPGIEFRWGPDFPHPFRPALVATQPPRYRFISGGKAAGSWRWPLTPSSA